MTPVEWELGNRGCVGFEKSAWCQEMPFTADQYSQIAEGYENAAADPLVAGEKRVDLVKKAEWFRFLAQRERAHEERTGLYRSNTSRG